MGLLEKTIKNIGAFFTRSCNWRYNQSMDLMETSCNEECYDSGIGYKYCPYCGRKMVIKND